MEKPPTRTRRPRTASPASLCGGITVGQILTNWRSSNGKKAQLPKPIKIRYPKGYTPPSQRKRKKKNYDGGDSEGDDWASDVSEGDECDPPQIEPLPTPEVRPTLKKMDIGVQTGWSFPANVSYEVICGEDGSITLKPGGTSAVVDVADGVCQTGPLRDEVFGEEIVGFADEDGEEEDEGEEEPVERPSAPKPTQPLIPGNVELVPIRVPAHRPKYTHEEDVALLRALLKGNNWHPITGVAYWKNLEGKVLPGRSWGSMKNRYFRNLKPNLDDYDLTPEEKAKLE